MTAKPVKRSQIPTPILFTAKLLASVSSKWATLFAARLFTTPIRHKRPKREIHMDRNSRQTRVNVNSIQKEVIVYEYGAGQKKILLAHGWSGRGTQLVKIADALSNAGYSIVSFDAPAHGRSPGKTTLMPEFVEAIVQIEKDFGPFEAAVGHSLGGMSLLNAIRKGFKIQRLITIGSGDVIKDIFDDFIQKLELDLKYSNRMRIHFEKKSGESMPDYSAYIAARTVEIPVLVIHDNSDDEVPVTAAHHIHENLKNAELLLTDGLGHRKILGDSKVIERVVSFIQNKNHEIEDNINDRIVIVDGL